MDRSPGNLGKNLASSIIPGLNGTRAIAALSVVVYHWAPSFFGHNGVSLSALSPGPYAVIFFFVLSGFLITTLLLREEARSGSVSLKGFWIRRGLRILPGFYVYLAIQALLIHKFPPDFLATALYMSNYYQAFGGWFTSLVGHTWSLSVEEQFYLLWPLAFVLITNRKHLKTYLLIGIILVEFLRVFGHHFGVPTYYTYFAFEFRSDALMIGCWMAIHLRENPVVPRWMMSKILTLLLLSVFPLLMLGPEIHKGTIIVGPLGFTIGAYASALLLVQTIGYGSALLNNKFMNYMGSISYSIYLYHVLVLDLTRHLFYNHGEFVLAFTYFGGTILAASLSYLLVEKQFLKMKVLFEVKPKFAETEPATSDLTAQTSL